MTTSRTEIQDAAKAAGWRHRPHDSGDHFQDIFKRGAAVLSVSYKSNGAVFFGHYDVTGCPRIQIDGRQKKDQVIGYLQSVPANGTPPLRDKGLTDDEKLVNQAIVDAARGANWKAIRRRESPSQTAWEHPTHAYFERIFINRDQYGAFQDARRARWDQETQKFELTETTQLSSKAIDWLNHPAVPEPAPQTATQDPTPTELSYLKQAAAANGWVGTVGVTAPHHTRVTFTKADHQIITTFQNDSGQFISGRHITPGPGDATTQPNVLRSWFSTSLAPYKAPEPETEDVHPRQALRDLAKAHGWRVDLTTRTQDRFIFQHPTGNTTTLVANYDPYDFDRFDHGLIGANRTGGGTPTQIRDNIVNYITRNGVPPATLGELAEAFKRGEITVSTPEPDEYAYEVRWTAARETCTYIADDERDAIAYAEYLRTTERGTGIRAVRRSVTYGPWEDVK